MSTQAFSREFDRYYTPAVLAEQVLEGVSARRVSSIADFAIGGGALVAAALRLWPGASVVGVDIDDDALKALAERHPHWQLIAGDFYSSVGLHDRLSDWVGGVDLVVLNPPFSARGNRKRSVLLDGIELGGSPPAAFVARALPFVSAHGLIRAIVPRNTLESEKDSALWEAIQQTHDVTEVHLVRRGAFRGATAEAVVIELSRRNLLGPSRKTVESSPKVEVVRAFPGSVDATLTRGNVPMHKVVELGAGSVPLLHSTSLKHAEGRSVRAVGSIPAASRVRLVHGSALLLPRVGLPSRRFFRPLFISEPSAMTDCVYAITADASDIDRIYERLSSAWGDLRGEYLGSCARYLTLRKLRLFLDDVGVNVLDRQS